MRLKSHPEQEKHDMYLASSVNKGAVVNRVLAVSCPLRCILVGSDIISIHSGISVFNAGKPLYRKTKCYFIRLYSLMVRYIIFHMM